MSDRLEQARPRTGMGGGAPLALRSMMRRKVVRVGMDSTLSEAMTVCSHHRIRHLPVVDENEKLVGILTDRDLRFFLSHRIGTVMETVADRETLHHHVHVLMVRKIVTAGPDMDPAEAAGLMLDHHVGCLPVVDAGKRLLGIVTAGDFLRLFAGRLEENSDGAAPPDELQGG